MNYENVADQFVSNVKDISHAARLLVGVVRQHLPANGPTGDLGMDCDGFSCANRVAAREGSGRAPLCSSNGSRFTPPKSTAAGSNWRRWARRNCARSSDVAKAPEAAVTPT